MTVGPAVLAARGLRKRFPGVQALDGADLSLAPGEVHAVVGENGAGKSTLMRILSGAARPDEGVLELDGASVAFSRPHDAHAVGIRMVHQELALVPALTVAENMFLGAEPRRGPLLGAHTMEARARTVLDGLHQAIPANAVVEHLALAQRQMVEIAKAVAHRSRVLILDEPTAILSAAELESLFELVARLRADGLAIAYITHRLDEVERLADRVTVLRDGKTVGSGARGEWTRASLIKAIVGRELADGAGAPALAHGDALLRVDDIAAPGVTAASLVVHAGEIVSLVGLVGAGRTELARAICGAALVRSGRMTLADQPYAPASPGEAIARGVVLVPEDRKAQGLILHDSVRANATLGLERRFARGGFVRQSAQSAAAREWVDRLHVRAASLEQPVRTLSGGNQQKVVLARALLAGARLLVVDEPTRGVDVGAKAEIHDLLRALAAGGAAVIAISSELPEALALGDRVIVMREGRTVAELTRAQATPERVGAAMLGQAVA